MTNQISFIFLTSECKNGRTNWCEAWDDGEIAHFEWQTVRSTGIIQYFVKATVTLYPTVHSIHTHTHLHSITVVIDYETWSVQQIPKTTHVTSQASYSRVFQSVAGLNKIIASSSSASIRSTASIDCDDLVDDSTTAVDGDEERNGHIIHLFLNLCECWWNTWAFRKSENILHFL